MFNIEYVKNPIWCNEKNTAFDCTVKFSGFKEELPVTVDSLDQYPHIQELWTNGVAGKYGAIKEYVAPPPPPPIPEVKNQPTVVGAQSL